VSHEEAADSTDNLTPAVDQQLRTARSADGAVVCIVRDGWGGVSCDWDSAWIIRAGSALSEVPVDEQLAPLFDPSTGVTCIYWTG
jgi:hypothetical protein